MMANWVQCCRFVSFLLYCHVQIYRTVDTESHECLQQEHRLCEVVLQRRV